jgi:hypothetical protein
MPKMLRFGLANDSRAPRKIVRTTSGTLRLFGAGLPAFSLVSDGIRVIALVALVLCALSSAHADTVPIPRQPSIARPSTTVATFAKDDEVIVAFAPGEARSPIVLGALWSGKDKPPDSASSTAPRLDLRIALVDGGHPLLTWTELAGAVDYEVLRWAPSAGWSVLGRAPAFPQGFIDVGASGPAVGECTYRLVVRSAAKDVVIADVQYVAPGATDRPRPVRPLQ